MAHKGEIVGRLDGDPILDEQTYNKLHALFAGRNRGRVADISHMGTGILRCGVCGRKLTARTSSDKTYPDGERRSMYFCAKQRRGCGKVFVDRRAVDAELLAFTVRRMSDKRHVAAARAQTRDRLSAVREEIEQIEKLQAVVSERLGRRQMSVAAFDAANEPLVLDLIPLIAERDSLTGDGDVAPVVTVVASPEAIEKQWRDGDVAERRGMLTRALDRDRMVVFPARRPRKRVFDRSRLDTLDPEQFAALTAAYAKSNPTESPGPS